MVTKRDQILADELASTAKDQLDRTRNFLSHLISDLRYDYDFFIALDLPFPQRPELWGNKDSFLSLISSLATLQCKVVETQLKLFPPEQEAPEAIYTEDDAAMLERYVERRMQYKKQAEEAEAYQDHEEDDRDAPL